MHAVTDITKTSWSCRKHRASRWIAVFIYTTVRDLDFRRAEQVCSVYFGVSWLNSFIFFVPQSFSFLLGKLFYTGTSYITISRRHKLIMQPPNSQSEASAVGSGRAPLPGYQDGPPAASLVTCVLPFPTCLFGLVSHLLEYQFQYLPL